MKELLLTYNRPEAAHAMFGVLGAAVVGGVQPAIAIIFASMITLYYLTDMVRGVGGAVQSSSRTISAGGCSSGYRAKPFF